MGRILPLVFCDCSDTTVFFRAVCAIARPRTPLLLNAGTVGTETKKQGRSFPVQGFGGSHLGSMACGEKRDARDGRDADCRVCMTRARELLALPLSFITFSVLRVCGKLRPHRPYRPLFACMALNWLGFFGLFLFDHRPLMGALPSPPSLTFQTAKQDIEERKDGGTKYGVWRGQG